MTEHGRDKFSVESEIHRETGHMRALGSALK